MMQEFKHITHNHFLQLALKDPTINFIAYVVTPWHAISLDASLLYMQSKGIQPKGIVLMDAHVHGGLSLNEESFVCDCYELYVREENGASTKSQEEPQKKENKFKAVIRRRLEHMRYYKYIFFGGLNWKHRRELYIINQVVPETELGLQLRERGIQAKFVVSDEGMGSYFPYFGNWEDDTQHPYVGKWYNLPAWAKYFRNRILGQKWIFAFHPIIETTILKWKGKELYPREVVLPYYREVFKRHVHLRKDLPKCDFEKSIVMVTSVFVEEQKMYGEDYIRVWQEVCDRLHAKGYKLYLKTHPRDTYYREHAEKLHCEVIDAKGLSIEELCMVSKPMCIIGLPSTALITPNLFYDILTICMFDLMNQEQCTQGAKNVAKYYEDNFGKWIRFAKSFNNLDKYLNEIWEKTKY